MDPLLELRNTVVDEESFVRFLKALSEDRADEVEKEKQKAFSPYTEGANGWQHSSIENFLDAAAAWAEDSNRESTILNGLPGYTKPTNPWKRCADIIYAGKFYE